MRSTPSSAGGVMERVDEQRIVHEWLRRVDAEMAGIPRARRGELVDELADHLAEAVAEAPPASEAELRELLDRMGDPAEIAEAARDGDPPPAPERRGRALEIWTLVALLPGSLILPVVGWLVGVVLLWNSRIFTTQDKLIGTLLVPGGLTTSVFVLFGNATVCYTGDNGEVCEGGLGSVETAVMLAVAFMPFVTTAYLAFRLSRAKG